MPDLNTANAEHQAKHGYPLLVIWREHEITGGVKVILAETSDRPIIRVHFQRGGALHVLERNLTWLPDAD